MADQARDDFLGRLVAASPDPRGAEERVSRIVQADPSLSEDGALAEKVVAVAGASRALATVLTRHPHLLKGAHEDDSLSLKLHAALFDIAGDELLGRIDLAEAMRRLTSVADHLAAEALELARRDTAERHPASERLRFAIIAMGKWGAGELNYYSDLDLIFVHEPAGNGDEERRAAQALAARFVSLLSAPSFDGSVFNIDTDLRPEGATGPLTRSLEGYRTYYQRWGEPWELQALLKARSAAGDAEPGRRFEQLADEIIWERGLDPEALRAIRRLKERAEAEAPPRDLKRARGGIRDIEFTVQLLQLVHGRFDPELRAKATLDAVDALGSHGYIAPDESARLSSSYRFLRTIEHRLQLWDLRQTHELPTSPEDRDRLARSVGLTVDRLDHKLGELRAQVRNLHEDLYFRPILDSLAGIDSTALRPDQARLRLESLGFRDVAAASRAFEELTSGLSRRSRVMHQILPLALDWLSLSPDPDLGLAQLRLLLAKTPDHSALVTLLQNNPLAGERLCLLLGTGRLIGEWMDRLPEFVPRLADDARLDEIRDRKAATGRLLGLLDSRPELDAKVGTIRRFVRRRKLRIAARDILGEAPVADTLGGLSDTADAAIAGALHMIGARAGFGVVAMGKWGGRELSYGSDLDLMYVMSSQTQPDEAQGLAEELGRIVSEPSRHGPAYDLDPGLRPEGGKGPLVRSLDSYHRYYNEWAESWEFLALVKMRPVAGDPALVAEFAEMAGAHLWREHLPEALAADIRIIKARVEAERIPPGEDPAFHLKLGPGGLSDVEFATQLLQLKHGGRHPEVRVSSTLAALDGLRRHQLVSEEDYSALTASYLFSTRARLRLHLQRGVASDSLPTDPVDSSRLAVSLGLERTDTLREHYRRTTRRARRSFERIFYQ